MTVSGPRSCQPARKGHGDHEVLELEPSQIEDPSRIGSRWRSEFIRGIGKRHDQFIIIDIDRVFTADDLYLFKGMEATAETRRTAAA